MTVAMLPRNILNGLGLMRRLTRPLVGLSADLKQGVTTLAVLGVRLHHDICGLKVMPIVSSASC